MNLCAVIMKKTMNLKKTMCHTAVTIVPSAPVTALIPVLFMVGKKTGLVGQWLGHTPSGCMVVCSIPTQSAVVYHVGVPCSFQNALR